MSEIYVVSCCRTAIGSFGGALKDTPAAELGAVVIKQALIRANLKPEQVDEVALGCTLGQAITGVSTLAIGSLIAFAAIVVGGVAGMKTLERMA